MIYAAAVRLCPSCGTEDKGHQLLSPLIPLDWHCVPRLAACRLSIPSCLGDAPEFAPSWLRVPLSSAAVALTAWGFDELMVLGLLSPAGPAYLPHPLPVHPVHPHGCLRRLGDSPTLSPSSMLSHLLSAVELFSQASVSPCDPLGRGCKVNGLGWALV